MLIRMVDEITLVTKEDINRYGVKVINGQQKPLRNIVHPQSRSGSRSPRVNNHSSPVSNLDSARKGMNVRKSSLENKQKLKIEANKTPSVKKTKRYHTKGKASLT